LGLSSRCSSGSSASNASPNSTRSSPRCCSPIRSARPRGGPRSATAPGKSLVERHHAVVRDALERWRGVENDTAGDGFYATFDGPARAIRCALEIGQRLRDQLGLEVRAGVHAGECELVEGKAAGLTVSIGARIAANADASEVLVSQTVKDLVAGSGFTFEDRGEHELRGIPDRWRLYRASPHR
jgi:class 3 adenylate cyclase